MSKKTKQTMIDENRINRWRSYIGKRLECIKSAPAYTRRGGYVKVELIEELENKSIEDIIVSRLRKKFGIGYKKLDYSQKYYHEDLKWYDTQSTLRRNNHDREAVSEMLFFSLNNHTTLSGAALTKFVRMYYRKGDCGTFAATERAIRAAINIR